MKIAALCIGIVCSIFVSNLTTLSAEQHSCKTQAIAPACYSVHGRLLAGNGTPAFRLWKIGTHNVLGIYSSEWAYKNVPLDNEAPHLPLNIQKIDLVNNEIFGDFEVCPLEPKTEGSMQAACIASAKDIFIKKY